MKPFFDYWNTKWALTVTAGILLGLSYPPVPLPILVFPAFLLIFRIIDLSASAREAAYWTYPGFVIWNIITTYWLMMATFAGGVAAILANAALMTIPVMLQYLLQKQKWQSWLIAMLQAAVWLSYEFLHHQWELAWPWLTIGNAWANVPQLVQYISVTGYWGITFWVLFASALAYQIIKKPLKSTKIALGCALLTFPLWSLAISLFSDSTPPENHQEVVVVQPNFDSYETHGGYPSPREAANHLLELTDSARTPQTDLVVWPENAIQTNMSNRDSYSRETADTKTRLFNTVKEWNTTLITGATFFEFYPSDEAPALPYTSGGNSYLPFNAALGFSPDQQLEVHRKHNLVPIVERVPYVSFLNNIDVFNLVDWSRSQGYGKGLQANQFSVDETKTPALICYDSVFPGWIRNYITDGAGYLTIITNDGWWGNTSGHEQHFAYARLRAIEFDRWIIRSANNGISGIISPDGSVKIETPYWESTTFRYEVPVLTSQTIYARFGDWLPILMLILSVFGIGYVGIRPFVYQKKTNFATSAESAKE